MSFNLRAIITISAKACSDLGMPIVVKPGDDTRNTVEFIVMTADGQVSISGTYDDIIEFGAQLMGRMFSWPLTNNRTEWFGQDDMQIIKKAVSDVRQQDGSDAAGAGNSGRSGEREGFPGDAA